MVLEPSEIMRAHITCRLIHTNLAASPEYETVSYVWGDPADTVEIWLEGTRVAIPKNLSDLLHRLRLTSKPRLLWADAVCINQADMRERNQQVNIMKNIYKSAKQVMIWVGEEADGSHLIFQHVKKWTTYCDDFAAGRTTWNDAVGEAHVNPPPYTGRTHDAFTKFCLRSWFFRTWVIQELSLSKEAIIMCGQDAETWSLLIMPTGFNGGSAWDFIHGVDGPIHLHHLDSIRGGNTSFGVVLKYSILCKATDPKDKVYGLRGLLDGNLIGSSVDYSLDVEVVYRRFARIIFEEAKEITILHAFGTQRSMKTLPSWVPDFSISNPVGVLARPISFSRISNEVSKLVRTILPTLRFEESAMIIRGHHIEYIYDTSNELVADPVNFPGSSGFARTMEEWESLATQINNTRLSRSISAAFLDTLIAQDNPGYKKRETSNETPKYLAWYDLFGSGGLRAFEPEYFRELDVIIEWWGGKYQEGWVRTDIDQFTDDMKECCYGRSFFITDQGSMGLAPPRARPGDSIVFFPGGLYPFVLRPRDDGAFSMIGDCYLYDFDEFSFTVEEVNGFEEFVLR